MPPPVTDEQTRPQPAKVNLEDKFGQFDATWAPRIVGATGEGFDQAVEHTGQFNLDAVCRRIVLLEEGNMLPGACHLAEVLVDGHFHHQQRQAGARRQGRGDGGIDAAGNADDETGRAGALGIFFEPARYMLDSRFGVHHTSPFFDAAPPNSRATAGVLARPLWDLRHCRSIPPFSAFLGAGPKASRE